MNVVTARHPLPFEITAYDMRTNLIAALKVYDVTSGQPVLVATVLMAHLINGTYWGTFMPSSGKAYVSNVAFYKTSALTEADETYSPASSAFAATLANSQSQAT